MTQVAYLDLIDTLTENICPAGSYLPDEMTDSASCAKCSIGCSYCMSGTWCDYCADDYSLNNGTCSCGVGKYS